MKNWNLAYKQKGIIQKPVLYIVEKSVDILRANGAKKILDLGFGTGRHTIFLLKNGFNVYGIDISEEGYKITSDLLSKEGLTANLVVGDIKKLPYEDNSFDAVISTFVLGHGLKNDIIKSFNEIKRVLKNHGILILALLSTGDDFCGQGEELEENTFLGVPDVDHDIPHHFFTEKEIKELLPGFRYNYFEEKTGFCINNRRQVNEGFFEIIAQKEY